MNLDDIMFGRRIRQNHALEHATITVLSGMVPDLSISARSSSTGFIIFGNVDLGLLRRALDEALRRLQAGEASLAIHPNCGTNLAVGVSLMTIGTMLGMTSSRIRTRVTSTVAASLAGLVAARRVRTEALHDPARPAGCARHRDFPPQNSWIHGRRGTYCSGVTYVRFARTHRTLVCPVWHRLPHPGDACACDCFLVPHR